MEVTSVAVGIASVVAIVVFIYAGAHIAIALGMISFVGVVLLKGNLDIALNLLSLAMADSIADEAFATVPLYVMMGLVVSRSGLGRDIYEFANDLFRSIGGGLGIATVVANAIFASVTGSSIASSSVFAKVAIPEMLRYRYGRRFAVGVVAGSSVLGMIIPPSVMLIIYAVVTEQSVGAMFWRGCSRCAGTRHCMYSGHHRLARGEARRTRKLGDARPGPGRSDLPWSSFSAIYGGILSPVESSWLVAAMITGVPSGASCPAALVRIATSRNIRSDHAA
jgi:hypothetical protein